MKRTTLILEDECLAGVRDVAHQSKRQMSQVVNDLLAEGLRHRRQHQKTDFKLISFPMGKPLVNLADRDAIEMRLES